MVEPSGFVVVCAHFYPVIDARIEGQYVAFRRQLVALGIPIITMAVGEHYAAWRERYPEVVVVPGDLAFQKERLWTLGARRAFAAGHAHVLCVDADVVFLSGDWRRHIADALATHDVVHPFETMVHRYADTTFWCRCALDRSMTLGTRVPLRARAAKAYWDFVVRTFSVGRAVGFGVAFNRRFFDDIGLYQHAIVGGGDRLLWDTLLRYLPERDPARRRSLLRQRLRASRYPDNAALIDDVARWVDAAAERCAGLRVGFARDVHATALPYGQLSKRAYFDRYALLAGFDPARDLRPSDDTGLVFTPEADPLREAVAGYLRTRNA